MKSLYVLAAAAIGYYLYSKNAAGTATVATTVTDATTGAQLPATQDVSLSPSQAASIPPIPSAAVLTAVANTPAAVAQIQALGPPTANPNPVTTNLHAGIAVAQVYNPAYPPNPGFSVMKKAGGTLVVVPTVLGGVTLKPGG